jgi:diadenosine tetraphosphate (Ap4A) HIT family hydrolase
MVICPNCGGNKAADRGDDPWAIARLQTGYVKLARTQYYRGATFFVAKACVAELHELSRAERRAHLMEMSEVAAAVFDAFVPRKLNYEALGNSVPHLHWWLTPRHIDDARATGPIWEDMSRTPARPPQLAQAARRRRGASIRRIPNVTFAVSTS